MAFNTTLGSFKPVEIIQQGQTQIKFVNTPLTIDVSQIEAITPYWNDYTGSWDNTKCIGILKSGISVNINSSYATLENILVPPSSTPPPAEEDTPALG